METPPNRPAKGSSPPGVPDHVDFELTPRTRSINRRLTMSATGDASEEMLIDVLVRRMAEEQERRNADGGDGGGGGKKKTYLGLEAKEWVKWAVKGAIAAVIFIALWYKTVNRELESKATQAQVEETAQRHVLAHEKHGDHATIYSTLEQHRIQLRKLSDIQIRQTSILENHQEDLSEAKNDIKRLRR